MGRRVDPPLSLTECASQLTGSLFFINLSATHAHIAAHLFAGVGDLQNNTDTNNSMDLNLDSPANANTFNGAVDKLRDKEKSIKYVASGRPHPHPNHHTDGSLSDTPYTAYWNKYAHPAKNPNGKENLVRPLLFRRVRFRLVPVD